MEVRLTARQGYLADMGTGVFRLSTLTLLGGPPETCTLAEARYPDRRGLYWLGRNGQNSAGETREFGTRGFGYGASGADGVLFAFPDEPQQMDLDTNVAESLAIVSLTFVAAVIR